MHVTSSNHASADYVRPSMFAYMSVCVYVIHIYSIYCILKNSLDVDDTLSLLFFSSHNVATSSHPIITLLNNFKFLPCKGLVKKSFNILLFGKWLTLILPFFILLATQKNLILVCLDLLEHYFFPFLAILSAALLACHKMFDLIRYTCDYSKYSYQMLCGRYSLLPISYYFFKLLRFIFYLLYLAVSTQMPKVLTPHVCPLMSICTVWDKST